MRARTTALLCLAMALAACGNPAKRVGGFSNDWTGNEIVVEALHDPDVEGVTCHVTHFDRSLIDRISKGNWFEDPSNASIACRQTGPIRLGHVDDSAHGREIFNERVSLVFKNLAVRRIFDKENQTLVYVVYSRKPVDGSAKMSVSTVPLYQPGLPAPQEVAAAPAR